MKYIKSFNIFESLNEELTLKKDEDYVIVKSKESKANFIKHPIVNHNGELTKFGITDFKDGFIYHGTKMFKGKKMYFLEYFGYIPYEGKFDMKIKYFYYDGPLKFFKQEEEDEKEESNTKVEYITGKQFKSKKNYLDLKKLWKGYFKYETRADKKEHGVSDINQFGKGSYFCTTKNCEDHYSNNIGFYDSNEFELSNDATIAIGTEEAFYANEKDIRKKADGFYAPEADTLGLILWNKKAFKEI